MLKSIIGLGGPLGFSLFSLMDNATLVGLGGKFFVDGEFE